VNDSADAGKYHVGNQGPVQGQVVGDHAQVYMYPPVHSSPSPPERTWNIPFQRNGFFLGQESLLSELHQQLTGGTTTALTQIQAISGLGGIGKTQITSDETQCGSRADGRRKHVVAVVKPYAPMDSWRAVFEEGQWSF